MEQRDPKVITIVSAMFGQNCYIVYRDNRSDCVVIDPGLDWGKIIRNIVNLGLAPAAILITHGHADHIAGVEAVKERWPAAEIVVGKQIDRFPSQPLSGLRISSSNATRRQARGGRPNSGVRGHENPRPRSPRALRRARHLPPERHYPAPRFCRRRDFCREYWTNGLPGRRFRTPGGRN